MGQGGGKGVFLLALVILAAVLVLTVYQVPQPWRGILVGWLVFVATAGVFALRLLGHYYQYKSLQLTTRQSAPGDPGPRAGRRPRKGHEPSLKVVVSNAGGNGRHVLR